MNYQQYKSAALKHLLTCEYMIANLGYERQNKIMVLRNAYYLCGYTFEGLVNFWIFKLLKSEGLIENDDTSSINNPIILPNGKKLGWTKEKKVNGITVMSDYWISQHKFMKNIEVFECIGVGDLFTDVPILGDPSLVSRRTLDLFFNWNVEIRYKENPVPRLYPERGYELKFENDIKDFIVSAREIWDQLSTIRNV